MEMLNYITIDENSRIPKYKQIVDSIVLNISLSKLQIDQQMPSINRFSEEFCLSRDTVEKAYNILKKRKIISSTPGKGYYITRTELVSKTNVLFMINKLSTYKMRIYNSFINSLGTNAHVDLHIYHCDTSLFLNLIKKNLGAYDYYLIMTHFKTESLKHVSSSSEVLAMLEQVPRDKLILLDNNNINLDGEVTEIYQDFKEDIYNALKDGLIKIKKYKKLFLVYPQHAVYPYPKRILQGFQKFCQEYSLDYEIIDVIFEDIILKNGDLFITIEESDLVSLVHQIREQGMVLGNDIGVISYNDTPLKELLGITVISTDFVKMGEKAASMILNHEKGKIKNPFNFIDRNSI
jgi:DNA-binding transcriptional regulator YhcF (GntR family)